MKTESNVNIPITEYMTPMGPWRFYYNHSTLEREEMDGKKTTMHTADFVEVTEINKENVVSELIRTRYSANEEAGIHRKFIAKEAGSEDEFNEYNQFVNWCKEVFNQYEKN